MFRKNRWILLGVALAFFGLAACDSDDDSGPTTPDAPAAPSSISISIGEASITITWSASANADSYTVQRQVAGGSFTALETGVTGTSYEDVSAQVGTTYAYRVIAVGEGGSSAPSDPVFGTVEEDEIEYTPLTGNVTDVMTLDADNIYLLSGILRIGEGGVLNIPAGTTIVGNLNAAPSAIFVEVGGQIFSNGTATNPVVMTSQRVVDPSLGEPQDGDWAGLVLLGDAQCSFPEDPCVAEGGAGSYGGDDNDDNSGRIMYTRIEYGGYEVSFGNELNALTFFGVGSGTEIHHVQTHAGLDDGFEWFGGAVDANYLLATDISDDSFDFSTGWIGRGQFWIAQQDPNDADTGYEIDGNERDHTLMPYTNPQVYNVTLVGKGETAGVAGESTTGTLFRRGTAGTYGNHLVLGFGSIGFDIDNTETVNRVNDGSFMLMNSIYFGNATDLSDDEDGIDDAAIFNTAGWNNQIVDPQLADPYDRNDPDFRPAAGSPAATGNGATPPDDGFFDTSATWIGAVADGGDEWYMEEWTRWGDN